MAVDLFIGLKRLDIIKNFISSDELVNAEAWDVLKNWVRLRFWDITGVLRN